LSSSPSQTEAAIARRLTKELNSSSQPKPCSTPGRRAVSLPALPFSFLIFGRFFFPSLLLLLCCFVVKGGFSLPGSSAVLPRLVGLDIPIGWLLEAIPFIFSLLRVSWPGQTDFFPLGITPFC
jgi:hypothetical protein